MACNTCNCLWFPDIDRDFDNDFDFGFDIVIVAASKRRRNIVTGTQRLAKVATIVS